MTHSEMRTIAQKSPEEILTYILENPKEEEELLYFLKTKMEYKQKFYNVSSLLKDSKSNSKGVGALTVEILQEASKNAYREIEINLLKDNPYQPRLEMAESGIEELANSIEKEGLQSPIKVTPNEDGSFTIAYGHRRVAAHKFLKLDKIKCFVEELDDVKLRRVSLTENLQREDLSFIDKALAYKDALDYGGFATQKELAEWLGLRESKVSEILSLLTLDSRIINDFKSNDVTKDSRVLSLLNKINPEKQYEIYCLFKNKEIDREGVAEYLKTGVVKKNSQCEFVYKNKKFNLFYKTKIKDKNKEKEFKEFANSKMLALLKELKEKEDEMLS